MNAIRNTDGSSSLYKILNMEIELNHYVDECARILKDPSYVLDPEIQLRQFLMSFNKLHKNVKGETELIRCFGCDIELLNSDYIKHLRVCEISKRIVKKKIEKFNGLDELIVRGIKNSYKISSLTMKRVSLISKVVEEYLQGNNEFVGAKFINDVHSGHFEQWTIECPFCSQFYLKTHRKEHYQECHQFNDSIKVIKIVGDMIIYNSNSMIKIEDFLKEKLYEIKIKDENEFRRISFFLENNICFPYDEAINKL